MFVVIKEGVYRHDVVGTFDSAITARDAAETALKRERDNYHSFIVLETGHNRMIPERRVARCRRKDKKIFWEEGECFSLVSRD